jgi:hypothetical protein
LDSQFVAKIIAKLDTSSTINDLKKLEQELSKKKIKINPVIEKATATQEMKNYAIELQKILSGLKINVSTSDVLTSIKQIQREQEKLNVLQEKNQHKYWQGNFKESVQDLTATNTELIKMRDYYTQIEKEQEKQSALVNNIKTSISSGKVDTNVSNATLQYKKLSNTTTELEAEFKKLISLQTQLGNSTTDDALIANYKQFSATLDVVNSKIKQLSNETNITKMSDSMEIVSNRAKGAAGSFQAFLRQLKPTALKENATEINNISNAFEKAAISGKQIDLTKANAQLNAFKGNMKEADMLSRTFFGELMNNAYKMGSWMVLGGIIATAFRSIKNGVQTVKDLDAALTNVSYTTGFTSENLKNLGVSSVQMAKDLGTSAKNVLNAVQIYANANTSMEEILKKSQASVILSNVTGMSTTDTSKSLLSIMNQFDMTEDQLMDISDIIQSVSQSMQHDFSKLIAA